MAELLAQISSERAVRRLQDERLWPRAGPRSVGELHPIQNDLGKACLTKDLSWPTSPPSMSLESPRRNTALPFRPEVSYVGPRFQSCRPTASKARGDSPFKSRCVDHYRLAGWVLVE